MPLALDIGPSRRHRSKGDPAGEKLVVLALAEYEALLDKADIAAADRAMADVEAGRERVIPAEIANRIIDGENKVRVWRSHRGLSARELVAAVGVSAPCISEIESGRKDGSVSVMKKIAEALKLDIDDLV